MTYKGIRQELVIYGLDTPTFSQSIANISKIRFFFDREFGENILEDTLENQGNKPASAIEMSNRLFTPIKDAGQHPEHVPFEKGVDPKGHLMLLLSEGELVHTEENSVYYYKLRNGR